MKKKFSEKLYKFAQILELILAAFIAIGIVVGFLNLANYLVEFYNSKAPISYDIFREFLSYVLILVVGVEFILMLLTPSIRTTAELVVFVIARMMLIYGKSMKDMVLGALALAIVFFIIKFLTDNLERKKDHRKKSI